VVPFRLLRSEPTTAKCSAATANRPIGLRVTIPLNPLPTEIPVLDSMVGPNKLGQLRKKCVAHRVGPNHLEGLTFMIGISTYPCRIAGAVLAIFLTASLGFQRLEAQVLYGSLVGNVTDSSGAAVPGAPVVVVHRETNQSRQSVTNDIGAFSFPTVQSGTYDIKVSKEGFQTLSRSGATVRINEVARVDVVMQIGQVTETVVVTAASALLQTDRSEVRHEISEKLLRDLPVPPGRNYQQLFRTIPGFTPPNNAHSVPSNPSRALQYNVNGTSSSSNDVRLDGASQFNVWLPHISAYVPALESIETVNVVTNNFDAEQGLAGGSAVNVQIKSGTNGLHGSGFWFHNNNAIKAKPFFLPQGQRNPKWVFNQYGGTIGGPIKKDKVFYFVSYEGTRDHQYASRFATVPTAAMRAGNLSESDRPVYDPATGTLNGSGRVQFPGNIIPANRLGAISQKIQSFFPLPNLGGDLLTNNYFAGAAYAFDRDTLDSKVNWNANSKLSMYARFSILDYGMLNTQTFGDAGGPGISGAGGNPGSGFGNSYSGTVAATYVVSPSLIIDGNFGYTLMDTNVEQPLLDEKIGQTLLGIPGTNGPRRFEGGWPRFSISNYTNLGIDNAFMPYYRTDPQSHYAANASLLKSRHNVRFGFDYAKQALNHTQPEFSGASHGAQGGFTFAGGPTQVRGGPSSNQFNSYGTFLLGLPTNIGRILQVPDEYTTRTSMHSLFIRDQWQVTPRLTLTLGTRWEYFPMPTRKDRGLERYDFDRNKMLVCGIGNIPKDCGISQSKTNFAPRFGFAWRATDKFVVRGGYGMTNDPYNLARSLRTNHPILLAQSISPPDQFLWAGRLEDGIPSISAPALGNGVIDIPIDVGANSLAPTLWKRGYIQSWNFFIGRQLRENLSAEIGYVATRSTNQLGALDLNAGQVIGEGRNGQPYWQRFGRFARTASVQPLGTNRYDSLQAKLTKRFSGGVQFGLSYTWSKALGVCGVTNSDNGPCVQALPYWDRNVNTVLGFDRTHNFQANGLWELPFGKGKRWVTQGFGGALLGGWQLNGLFSAYTGTPFSVGASGTSLNLPGSGQTADQVKPEVQKLGGVGRGQAYYDFTAFAQVTEPRFGNTKNNILRGPELVNVDLGLFRGFKVSERVTIQFRAEAFNATNTPHFSNPSNNISNLQRFPDGSFRGGVFEVTGVNGVGREGIDERVFRFGLRIGF